MRGGGLGDRQEPRPTLGSLPFIFEVKKPRDKAMIAHGTLRTGEHGSDVFERVRHLSGHFFLLAVASPARRVSRRSRSSLFGFSKLLLRSPQDAGRSSDGQQDWHT